MRGHPLTGVALVCALLGAGAGQETGGVEAEADVTFAEDVAPIVFEHCTPCHRAGEAGPFPMVDYQTVRRRARVISLIVRKGEMPPSLPDPDYSDIANLDRLAEEEVDVISRWVQQGAPPGDESRLPAVPEPEAWPLGPPDHVAEAEAGLTVAPAAVNLVRNFVVPLALDGDRWLEAIALKRPPSAVMKTYLFVLPEEEARSLAPADPAAPRAAAATGLGFSPHPDFGAQVLETEPWPLPAGVAQPLPDGSSLVIQAHLQGVGVEQMWRPAVGLYWADAPPSRRLLALPLGTRELHIPAGESSFHVRASLRLPVAVRVAGILTHAHLLAKEMRVWVETADQGEAGLLWIKEWDLRYQKPYWYRRAIALPAAATVQMDFRYDNSEENMANPHYPPRPVAWGPALTQEMAGTHLLLLVDGEEERRALEAAWSAARAP